MYLEQLHLDEYSDRIICSLLTIFFTQLPDASKFTRSILIKLHMALCLPCTTSSCGRMVYVYPEKNLRAYPGVERGSSEWNETYKIRVNVEKSISISTFEV